MKIFTSLLAVSLLSATLAASLFGSQVSTILFGASAAQSTAGTQKAGEKSPEDRQKDLAAQKALLETDRLARGLLSRCRSTLEGYQSYTTTLDEAVNVGGQKFTATGRFIKGQNLKHRLELNLEIGTGAQKTKASLIQVCDGRVLKSEQQIGKTKLTSRRDVKQILNAATKGETGRQNNEKTLIAKMGIGGITGLVASLEQTMAFDSQKPVTIGKQKAYLIEGGWNAAMRKYWIDLNGGAIPTHVPDRVRVLIDSEFLIREIEYLKVDPKNKDEKPQPMLTLKFRNIVANSALPDKTFEFETDERVYMEDTTDRYIQMINAINQGRAPSP